MTMMLMMWPHCQSQASAIHDPRCAHFWKQDHTHSAEPRQEHTDFGHPVAIVLPVGDSVNDLEVAFQRDYNETQLAGHCSEGAQGYAAEQHANCTVDSGTAAVVTAICKRHDDVGHSGHGGVEIHRALVGDQRVDAAAELSTSTNQDGQDSGVGEDAEAHYDQTEHCHHVRRRRRLDSGIAPTCRRCGGWIKRSVATFHALGKILETGPSHFDLLEYSRPKILSYQHFAVVSHIECDVMQSVQHHYAARFMYKPA